jgi:hypothetical protein
VIHQRWFQHLCHAYWEHQQLQKQISEQTKQTRLYADYDMNATFDRLFNQSNEEYEKLTDKGVEITFDGDVLCT